MKLVRPRQRPMYAAPLKLPVRQAVCSRWNIAFRCYMHSSCVFDSVRSLDGHLTEEESALASKRAGGRGGGLSRPDLWHSLSARASRDPLFFTCSSAIIIALSRLAPKPDPIFPPATPKYLSPPAAVSWNRNTLFQPHRARHNSSDPRVRRRDGISRYRSVSTAIPPRCLSFRSAPPSCFTGAPVTSFRLAIRVCINIAIARTSSVSSCLD